MPTKNAELRAKHNRAYYEKNKDRVRQRTERDRQRNYEFVNSLKAKPCTDCKKQFDPVCMDFDHMPEFEKISGISEMINAGSSIARLQREIDKCELVCANCHRIRTRNRYAPKVFR